MIFQRYRTWIRIVLIVYWSALFIGTHAPTVPSGVAEVSDKLLHYLAYGGLAFLLAMDQNARGPLTWRRRGQIFAVVAVYAALDELLQIPVGRTADIRDWVADILGALCGLGGHFLFGWGIRRIFGETPTQDG
ncbi:VanZ like family protein [Symmachiella macrocystis]|uniref:VanZ like family protein n=1 Tax=Symmachiella macrocystis TaxID=2527985 RepID=A0A5C6BGW6_9PLAN|nr:VanZ family protein [Symmachiella macrocystis]TWU11403.1 VanZ like family protein [Symmachiella macrocystis]